MLSAYLAAKAVERRNAERSAEFARQLPLYQEKIAEPPPEFRQQEAERAFSCRAPDWATNY